MVLHPKTAPAWLNKSDSIELPKEATGSTLTIGFGWQVPYDEHSDFDLDASAIGVKGDRVYSDEYFVFFNYQRTPDNSIVHTGDNQGTDGDQETILVNLGTLPSDLDKIIFPVSIYDADDRGQTFSQVRDAYIRIIAPGNKEIARYRFDEEASDAPAAISGELYRSHEKWMFRAVGQTFASGLVGVATAFSLNI
ncbi:TerD family protein [Streptomyces pseudovenezuelae]|uniref:TerD family protein n=1 Tax=Streptomyces pseudovenezuelae TaxID=67350 RepID=UPI0036E294B7